MVKNIYFSILNMFRRLDGSLGLVGLAGPDIVARLFKKLSALLLFINEESIEYTVFLGSDSSTKYSRMHCCFNSSFLRWYSLPSLIL